MKKKQCYILCVIFAGLFIIYLGVPYFDVVSSHWRSVRLKNHSITTFNSVVKNIDSHSTLIDARSEALAQCYTTLQENKLAYKSSFKKETKQNREIFKKNITMAFKGYRDSLSVGLASKDDYIRLIDDF